MDERLIPNQQIPPSPQRETHQIRDFQQDRCMQGERALTAHEMQAIEKKHAYQLEAEMRSFILFPTSENFQRIQTTSSAYITAWMNGRKRVLSD